MASDRASRSRCSIRAATSPTSRPATSTPTRRDASTTTPLERYPHPRLAFPIATESPSSVLIVCEGLPDALIATQAGLNAVALLGAQAPDEAVAARIGNHATTRGLDVVLACDPDDAGQRASQVLARLLDGRGVPSTVIVPPDGLDVNAWALADPDWAKTLRAAHSTPVVDADVDLDLEHP